MIYRLVQIARKNSSVYRVLQRTMATESSKFREMYPDIEPYDTGMLKVSDIHQVYYEQSGNKNGNPVIFLHGGPGGGTSARDRTFFDPNVYRIVLMDQRGAGKSLPAAELKENTTWNLVADVEKLREKLGIEKWVVFGGSWGSTLSLAYAETHPDRVKALILRGIFTLRRKEVLWYNQEGANFILPDLYEEYIEPIPQVERCDLIGAYYRRLTGSDEKVQLECAKAWSKWELKTSKLYVDDSYVARAEADIWALQFARIECHYFVNGGFFERDDQLLANVDKIRHIPTTIVQGRYDLVCPMETAWKLHRAFPEAEFHIIADAGHSNKEPGTQSKLLDACDKYKNL
ncbi:probable proline iminopeptidase isoform X2 [Ruditapes philippinarum]|uniref:probable proline iminopeptidase isoform X2 n=1 Tax=Ruditapes philippinarum TaxID=129788 RepID=UPI00295C095B|nr:probable proline iminopeptidase isoform X2 [Ruditapes philippinarum]